MKTNKSYLKLDHNLYESGQTVLAKKSDSLYCRNPTGNRQKQKNIVMTNLIVEELFRFTRTVTCNWNTDTNNSFHYTYTT